MIWIIDGVVLFTWVWRNAQSLDLFTLTMGLCTLTAAVVLIFIGLSRSRLGSRLYPVVAWGAIALFAINFAVWTLREIAASPGYGLDEAAFVQYAAQQWAKGLNPYGLSLRHALQAFDVGSSGRTWQLNGHLVTHYSYPALPFEMARWAQMLGMTTQTPIILSAIAWVVSVVLLYLLLPPPWQMLSIILGSFSPLISSVVSGPIAVWALPFLIGAAFRWDTYSCRWTDQWRPVLMGVAISLNQIAWLLMPFVMVGMAREQVVQNAGWKTILRTMVTYLSVSFGVFFATNLLFIGESPRLWIKGIFAPFVSPLIPEGQGLIVLTMLHGLGGGFLPGMTGLALAVYSSLVVLVWWKFRWVKPWIFVLPFVALFVATRSFLYYLAILIPVGVVAAVSGRRVGPEERAPGRASGIFSTKHIALAWGLGLLTLTGGIFSQRGPLAMSIQSVHRAGDLQRIQQVTMRVHNRSNRPMSPHFASVQQGKILGTWTVVSGPRPLPAHHSARYLLTAHTIADMPRIGQAFAIAGLTAHPNTMSVSSSQNIAPIRVHLAVRGVGVHGAVAAGQPVEMIAQITSRWGMPVSAPHVALALSQTYYSSRGRGIAQATINRGQPGQSPVVQYTNRQGRARFIVKDAVSSTIPVMFTVVPLHHQVLHANTVGIIFHR